MNARAVIGFGAVIACLVLLLWWQTERRAAVAAENTRLAAELAGFKAQIIKTDHALVEWRSENENFARHRDEIRRDMREIARQDPSFQEFLATPLPAALLPGRGLLGGPASGGAAHSAAGSAAAHPGP